MISQTQLGSPRSQTGISQIQPDRPELQPGISQKLADTHRTQDGVDWDIPRKHLFEESNISLTREDQDLLCLRTKGLTTKEIGIRIGKTGKTVSNQLSVLRGMYGEERIPLRKTPIRKNSG